MVGLCRARESPVKLLPGCFLSLARVRIDRDLLVPKCAWGPQLFGGHYPFRMTASFLNVRDTHGNRLRDIALPGFCARDFPFVRVHQRLSRHRQRSGDGYLHQVAQTTDRGGLVGVYELPGGFARRHCGRLQHRAPPPCGFAGQDRHRRRHGHGDGPAAVRDHLELRHLVPGHPGFQLAHPDRCHHRSGSGQFVSGGPLWHGHQLA